MNSRESKASVVTANTYKVQRACCHWRSLSLCLMRQREGERRQQCEGLKAQISCSRRSSNHEDSWRPEKAREHVKRRDRDHGWSLREALASIRLNVLWRWLEKRRDQERIVRLGWLLALISARDAEGKKEEPRSIIDAAASEWVKK